MGGNKYICLSVCVCVCVHTCVCIHVFACIYMHIHVCTYVCLHVHVLMLFFVFTCVYVSTCIDVHVWLWCIRIRRGRGCMGIQSLNISYCPKGEAQGTVLGMKGLETQYIPDLFCYVYHSHISKVKLNKRKNILFYFRTPSTVHIFNPTTYETTSLIRN